MNRRIISVILLLLLIFCGCRAQPQQNAPENSAKSGNRMTDHLNERMLVSGNVLYYEWRGVVYRRSAETMQRTALAEGRLFRQLGENTWIFFKTAEGDLMACAADREAQRLFSAESNVEFVDQGEWGYLFQSAGKVYLLHRVDLSVVAEYPRPNEGRFVTYHNGTLYWYGGDPLNQSLCRLSANGSTEDLGALGYGGAPPPDFHSWENRLYFFHGYRLYCFDESGLRTVVSGKEGDHCSFYRDRAYFFHAAHPDDSCQVYALTDENDVTEELVINGVSSNGNGKIYYKGIGKLIWLRNGVAAQCTIPRGTDVREAWSMQNGIALKTTYGYAFARPDESGTLLIQPFDED